MNISLDGHSICFFFFFFFYEGINDCKEDVPSNRRVTNWDRATLLVQQQSRETL